MTNQKTIQEIVEGVNALAVFTKEELIDFLIESLKYLEGWCVRIDYSALLYQNGITGDLETPEEPYSKDNVVPALLENFINEKGVCRESESEEDQQVQGN